MANGFFLGGLAQGFQRQEAINNQADYQQGILKLDQQRLQNQKQQQDRDMFFQLQKQFLDSAGATINAAKEAEAYTYPNMPSDALTKKVTNAYMPSLSVQIDHLEQMAKTLGIPVDVKAQVSNLFTAPPATTTIAAEARAREGPLATEEKKARIDYLRSGIPAGAPGKASLNPDSPQAGDQDQLGGPTDPVTGMPLKRVAQVGTVDADVGEQAGADYLKRSVPAADQDMVQSLANYDTDPTTLSGRVPRGQLTSRREQMLDYAMAYSKAKGETYVPRAFKVVQDFLGTGRHGDQVRSLNVATEHLSTLRSLGEALQNGDIQAFNSIAQRWAQETGKSAPTNLNAAKTIVGTEIIKAIGVAGAGSKEEREDLGRQISTASSPQQIVDAIDDVYGPLLTGQLKGLRSQYLSGGGPRERFDKAMLPSTREFLDRDKPKKKEDSGITVHGFTFTPSQ